MAYTVVVCRGQHYSAANTLLYSPVNCTLADSHKSFFGYQLYLYMCPVTDETFGRSQSSVVHWVFTGLKNPFQT